ncbi:MAG: hypothetical protein U0Q18_31355 [Bryobacteraceae bacterium]
MMLRLPLLSVLYVLHCCAQTPTCTGLPTQFTGTEFPSGDFFSNFNNPCYTIPLGKGHGGTSGSDLNSIYYKLYFKVDPRYELIVLGTFPNSRYFAVTAYDEHSAISQSISDVNIVPLTGQDTNPYLVGSPFSVGQRYAVPIELGGILGNQETGCMMQGYNVAANKLDATLRHGGMDWNSDSDYFRKFPTAPLHVVDTPEHTNPNRAGTLMLRSYLDITPGGYDPVIIVRDVASGCAYPATYVQQVLQILTRTATGNSWLDGTQVKAHLNYELKYLTPLCYAADPQNMLLWAREPEYVALINPDSSYTNASVPAGLPDSLAAAGEVMRIRLRLASFPPTPCANGCSRSGQEQQRYTSLSFQNSLGNTLASFADNQFVADSNGYATMIVSTGASVPSWVAPANGYTYLNLAAIPGYEQLSWLLVRNILPSSGFACSGERIPFDTAENTPAGGLMGEYLPVVDYPLAATLPQTATPFTQTNSCGILPAGQALGKSQCGIVASPPMTIASAVTQCPAPGCNAFVAQPQPPITIVGTGFGAFPNILPYSGTTGYLKIIDWTQGWAAGYTGNTCTVSIDKWAVNRISFVANVGQNGACPLLPGDQISITVWNPQSVAATTVSVTASEP